MNKIYKKFEDLPKWIREIAEKELNTPEEKKEFARYFTSADFIVFQEKANAKLDNILIKHLKRYI